MFLGRSTHTNYRQRSTTYLFLELDLVVLSYRMSAVFTNDLKNVGVFWLNLLNVFVIAEVSDHHSQVPHESSEATLV